ncbi:unnamed protein product [Polarella glacialis]|uniref:Pentacotripeptide-repeat region of PRORP domain-containing protein n=1 Tax=Polarella glacialis TaxID=89957 RepID=A0A813E044_POLGL|nr:unnamed protein product [Polarella glacialis]
MVTGRPQEPRAPPESWRLAQPKAALPTRPRRRGARVARVGGLSLVGALACLLAALPGFVGTSRASNWSRPATWSRPAPVSSTAKDQAQPEKEEDLEELEKPNLGQVLRDDRSIKATKKVGLYSFERESASDFLNGEKIAYEKTNPKSPGTEAFRRYELYKRATSVAAARKKGATSEDVMDDWYHGYLSRAKGGKKKRKKAALSFEDRVRQQQGGFLDMDRAVWNSSSWLVAESETFDEAQAEDVAEARRESIEEYLAQGQLLLAGSLMEKAAAARVPPALELWAALITALVSEGELLGAQQWHQRLIDSGLRLKRGDQYQIAMAISAEVGDVMHSTILFDRMIDAGYAPDDASYMLIFKACSRCGSEKYGERYVKKTAEKFFCAMIATDIMPQELTISVLDQVVGVPRRLVLYEALGLARPATPFAASSGSALQPDSKHGSGSPGGWQQRPRRAVTRKPSAGDSLNHRPVSRTPRASRGVTMRSLHVQQAAGDPG